MDLLYKRKPDAGYADGGLRQIDVKATVAPVSFVAKRVLIGALGLFGLLDFLLNGLGASGVANLQQQFLGGFQFANAAFYVVLPVMDSPQ